MPKTGHLPRCLRLCVALCLFATCGSVASSGPMLSFEELLLTPAGPLIEVAGATVTVNCSQIGLQGSGLQWHLPWEITLGQDAIIEKGGSSRGRFSVQWIADDTLQLVIFNLEDHDSGNYQCSTDSGRHLVQKKAVKIWVTGKYNSSMPCEAKFFRCGTGHCIYLRYRCDTKHDCPDGSDEANCKYDCQGQFQCDSGQCIDKRLMCDKSKHCRDGSDEKNCGYVINYTGKIGNGDNTGNGSVGKTPGVGHPGHNDWHFNAIYSGIAAVVGLVCVVAVVIVTVCRIHMRRESMRQMGVVGGRGTRRRRRPCASSPWQHLAIGEGAAAAAAESGRPQQGETDPMVPHRCLASTNLAVNINVRFNQSGLPEFFTSTASGTFPMMMDDMATFEPSSMAPSSGGADTRIVTPPPYSEIDGQLPRGESPPPPYSTIDRQKSDWTPAERSASANVSVPSPTGPGPRSPNGDAGPGRRQRLSVNKALPGRPLGAPPDPVTEVPSTSPAGQLPVDTASASRENSPSEAPDDRTLVPSRQAGTAARQVETHPSPESGGSDSDGESTLTPDFRRPHDVTSPPGGTEASV